MVIRTMYKVMKGNSTIGIGPLDDCRKMLCDICKDMTYHQIEKEQWRIDPARRTALWAALNELSRA